MPIETEHGAHKVPGPWTSTISLHDPDIVFVSEAQYEADNNEDRDKLNFYFKYFKTELRPLESSNVSRSMFLIKPSVNYVRCEEFKHPEASTIIIRVMQGPRKLITLAGTYRQWHKLDQTWNCPTIDSEEQSLRFYNVLNVWKDSFNNKGDHHLFGDINIDCNISNDPMKQRDLRLLIPKFDGFLGDQLLTQMNWEDTRFPGNQQSSLLDLIVTHAPEKVDSILAHHNPCSKNVILTWSFKVNPVTYNQQL